MEGGAEKGLEICASKWPALNGELLPTARTFCSSTPTHFARLSQWQARQIPQKLRVSIGRLAAATSHAPPK
eukprot:5168570-Amphidinium_carterae.1